MAAASTTITKEMIIADILEVDDGIAKYLMEMGMHCLGCPSARGESLEDACLVHGTDVDELLDKINAFMAEK